MPNDEPITNSRKAGRQEKHEPVRAKQTKRPESGHKTKTGNPSVATGWENTSPVYTNQPHTPQKNTLTCNYLAPLVAHRLVPRRSLTPYDTVLPIKNRLRLSITHSAVGFPVCLGVWVVWLLALRVLGGGGSCLVCCVVSAWGLLGSLRSLVPLFLPWFAACSLCSLPRASVCLACLARYP